MALITVAGSKHSPGATTLMMGLAATWPATAGRRLLVVEADPGGGVLAARYEALRGERTLADTALMLRRGFRIEDVLASSRRMWGWLPVVVTPLPPRQAYEALAKREGAGGAPAAERLAVGLAGCPDVDVVVDIGRLTPQSPALPFIEQADVTLLVTRLGVRIGGRDAGAHRRPPRGCPHRRPRAGGSGGRALRRRDGGQ